MTYFYINYYKTYNRYNFCLKSILFKNGVDWAARLNSNLVRNLIVEI